MPATLRNIKFPAIPQLSNFAIISEEALTAADMAITTLQATASDSRLTDALSGVGNFFGPVSTICVSAYVIAEATKSKRRKTERISIAAVDLLISCKLMIVHGLTLTAKFAPNITTDVLPALGIASGVVATVATYVMLAKSIIDLVRSIQKLDTHHLFLDRIKKIESINKKIKVTENKEKTDKNTQELARLETEKTWLTHQAEALAAVAHQEQPNKEFYINQFKQVGIEKNDIEKPTPHQVKFAATLHEKQKEKVIENTIIVSMRALAALGATLVTLSFFFPPLFIPGIVCAAVATTYFVATGIGGKLYDYTMKRKIINATRKNVIAEYSAQANTFGYLKCFMALDKSKLSKTVKEETVVGFWLASQAAQKRGEKFNDFVENFSKQSKSEQSKICKFELKKIVKLRIMDQYLIDEGLDHNALSTADMFSAKDRDRALVTQGKKIFGFFATVKEKLASAPFSKMHTVKFRLIAMIIPIMNFLSDSILSFVF